MNEITIIIAFVSSWIFWKWSEDSFDDDREKMGWFWIVMSAFQFASGLSAII
jgi:hypothetical protein